MDVWIRCMQLNTHVTHANIDSGDANFQSECDLALYVWSSPCGLILYHAWRMNIPFLIQNWHECTHRHWCNIRCVLHHHKRKVALVEYDDIWSKVTLWLYPVIALIIVSLLVGPAQPKLPRPGPVWLPRGYNAPNGFGTEWTREDWNKYLHIQTHKEV